MRNEIRAGLEHLGQLALRRYTLHRRTQSERADTGRTGRILDREAQIDARRDAGLELVADRTSELEHGAPLGRCAQEPLVRDALFIEREHIRYAGAGIDECTVGSSLLRESS